MVGRSVDELFNDALERSPEERAAFLRQVCGNDDDLYTRISSLLALHDQVGSFMRAPLLEQARGGLDDDPVDPANPPTVTQKISADRFSPGQLLGDRYRMEALLGRGGMGEVWRAYDLKLRVDVALKCLHKDLFTTEQGLELLRHEVRSARNVVSPHVCRIFDLVAEDGQELVSMEYIDGRTLKDLLQEKAPLQLREAGEIAAQLLAGLEAIHNADLVHRDIKPANVMMTRAGRVVLMDFGLAKGLTDLKEGSIAGTPAYMAPEQARGAALDARADIFAAGVILAEMISPKDQASHEALWAGVRETPSKVPEGPWENVLRNATAWDPKGRFATARDMARALEEVTLRAEGVEDRTPYPGLSSFTEEKAEYFFGREAEVEVVWKKLQHLNLSAIVGLSGAGKSSFLQAGLIPAAPPEWTCVLATPGVAPFTNLAGTLITEMAGDAEAMRSLLSLDQPGVAVEVFGRWRRSHGMALLILDQFEELFTLNPPEVQAAFAKLLGELAFEADVHVLLSMREDFLFRCHDVPPLEPIFSELTPMGSLTGSALRRALVQPALACGYRFEDDALVDEMVDDVSDERGALPLLAFAAARMWEHRNRGSGTLTRRSYEKIGGVSGALAQHAEATLERIGPGRSDIVRELFRNLITSQGTRVARTTDELLSVFENPDEAKIVLDELVDARLLTSFELSGNGNGEDKASARHRIELIHESLLRTWPRLVRWQTQDADGAQLRDQLRQAAQLWEQRSQSDDLLWTGTAYRDFELWRERYPGGLSESEERFAAAMESRNLRQRRRRRIALTGAFITLLAVLAIVGTLWQRSERVARLNEAQRFQMLAEESLEGDNTLALALATTTIEREDTPETRRLALRALGKGPVHFTMEVADTLYQPSSALLSPDGEWLGTINEDGVLLWPRAGGAPRSLECEQTEIPYEAYTLDFHPDGKYLAAIRRPKHRLNYDDPGLRLLSLWTVPEGRRLGSWSAPVPGVWQAFVRGDPPRVITTLAERRLAPQQWLQCSPGTEVPTLLGVTDPWEVSVVEVDPSGRLLFHTVDDHLYVSFIDSLETAAPVLIGRHEATIQSLVCSQAGDYIASGDLDGTIRVWLRQNDGTYALDSRHEVGDVVWVEGFDRQNSRVAYMSGHEGNVGSRVSVLNRGKPVADSIEFLPRLFAPGRAVFTPDDQWLAFAWVDFRFGECRHVRFYPLRNDWPQVVHPFPQHLELSPDRFIDGGTRLASSAPGGELWICDLGTPEPDCGMLWRNPAGNFVSGGYDPLGEFILINAFKEPKAWVVPVDGSEPVVLEETQGCLGGVARDPYKPRIAVGGAYNRGKVMPDEPIIDIYDLATGEKQTLESDGDCGFFMIWFLRGDRLISHGREGLLIWDLTTGDYEVLSDLDHFGESALTADARFLVVLNEDGLALWDLEDRSEKVLPIPYQWFESLAISPDASFVVMGTSEGEIMVLPVDAAEPFVLSGHDGPVTALWITPDSQEIRSASSDGTVRIWPVPRGRRPVRNLPHGEFLAFLRAQTNLRVVTDVEAQQGYRVVYDEFSSWETVPPW